jgi:uncharacterized protein
MRVFERPGPINADEVIEVVETASSQCEHLVEASISGDSALRVAEAIRDKQIMCVTCPQGMNWEVGKMSRGPFAAIPELEQIRSEWAKQGRTR